MNSYYSELREKIDIYLSCTQLTSLQNQLDIQIRCSLHENGDWRVVDETEVCQNTSEPKFAKAISVDFIFEICQPIQFEILNVYTKSAPELLGTVQTTVGCIFGSKKQTSYHDLKIKDNKMSGQMIIEGEKFGGRAIHEERLKSQAPAQDYTFTDYIRGGTQLNVIVGIDFGASNGQPESRDSLHYMNPSGALNEYQKAIKSVCEIVMNYDHDQSVAVYGLGGKPHYPLMDTDSVSHCFPCNGDQEKHEVMGVQGIMDAYSSAVKNVEFSGPTHFAPLINAVLNLGKIHKDNDYDTYTTLLILTNGIIEDMNASIDAVVKASEFPVSIIIVGIGNADFIKMQILDGDHGLFDNNGRMATRDAAQFVPFNRFNGDVNQLTQHVLAELPNQLVQYMKMAGKKPKSPWNY